MVQNKVMNFSSALPELPGYAVSKYNLICTFTTLIQVGLDRKLSSEGHAPNISVVVSMSAIERDCTALGKKALKNAPISAQGKCS